MSFPDPEIGEGLEEFMEVVDVQHYCQHLVSVAHNRRWLAGQLIKQGRYSEAATMLMAAAEAEEQLLLAEGLLVNHNRNVEEA
tara:strand:+ start:96 stop:344 length:249 start_codon:yes stop_codon:yes gene_type:complete